MKRYQDIHIGDLPLKSEYIKAFNDGEYQKAEGIANSSNFSSKVFNAEIFNDVSEVLSNIEEHRDLGVEEKLENLASAFDDSINKLIYKGNWNNTVTYTAYNFVMYNNLIYAYINPTPSSGIVPTNTRYWKEIGLRGADGAYGVDLNLKVGTQNPQDYHWDATTQYEAKDLTLTTGKMWVAKRANINKNPTTSPSDWELFAEVENATIDSSFAEPDKKYIGQIWLEMLR